MTKKSEIRWGVLQNNELTCSYPTFAEAQREAVAVLEVNEGDNVKIIEIVRAWKLSFPEEPAPELHEIELSKL